MAKVAVRTLEGVKGTASGRNEKSGVRTHAYYNGDTDPIHLLLHELEPGSNFRIEGSPTDRLVYVWRGSADVGGVRLSARSSMIVEYDAAQLVVSGPEGAALLEFGVRERSTGAKPGGRVHLLPFERVPRTTNLAGSGKAGGALHADAGCPSCTVWLHENDFYQSDDETVVHSHSEDEIIFVRDGAIRLGAKLFGPGTALAVAANTKYGFNAGPEGLSFVNFRGSSPTYTSADGSYVLDEARFWTSELGVPEYLTSDQSSM